MIINALVAAEKALKAAAQFCDGPDAIPELWKADWSEFIRTQLSPALALIRASLTEADPVPSAAVLADREGIIKHMVDRFLSWHLPENFQPDGGISFKKFGNEGTPHQYKHDPTGTNLFDATQAAAMVRHMLEGTALAEKAASQPAAQSDSPLTAEERDLIDQSWLRHKALTAEAASRTDPVPSSLTAPSASVGEWQLVPRQPTTDMNNAGMGALGGWIKPVMHADDAYRAMLAAAPASPTPGKTG